MTLDPLDFVYDSEYAAILGATGEVEYLRLMATSNITSNSNERNDDNDTVQTD